MLEWAKDHIYTIASDEWSYQAKLEADPLIHLLIGACASEAQEVYDAIQMSDNRLLQRLLQYILPECFHVPLPAVAIARAQARTSGCNMPNTHSLVFKDADKELAFTPLFNTRLLNGKIRFIGTDTDVVERTDEPSYNIEKAVQPVSRLLVGIETPEELTSLENIVFYIDWAGDALEKRQLLSALSQSRWTCNGQHLTRQNGFLNAQEAYWQNHFDPEKELTKRLNAQFKPHFHLITTADTLHPAQMTVSDVLKAWLDQSPELGDNAKDTTARWTGVKGHFTWLRIDLPYRVALTDVERNLQFALNHFIIVNRTLKEKDDTDTYFSNSLGIEAIRISPEKGLFHSIRSVVNQIKNEPIPPLPLAQLIQQKNNTAYSFRIGGVGRSDDYNAWERLSYLFSVFRQEQRQLELVERLGNILSLEELHEAVGELVSMQKAKQAGHAGPQIPVYLFVQPGPNRFQLRVKVYYWTTAGETANGLPSGSSLASQPALAGLDASSIRLVTKTVGGKNGYSTAEQIQVLQDALYRRGRIVSAHDVKSLCHQKMGPALKEVSLRPYFETDKNPDGGGIRRAIEVALKVENPGEPYMHQLAQEIELDLQENSVGTTPYRVVVLKFELPESNDGQSSE